MSEDDSEKLLYFMYSSVSEASSSSVMGLRELHVLPRWSAPGAERGRGSCRLFDTDLVQEAGPRLRREPAQAARADEAGACLQSAFRAQAGRITAVAVQVQQVINQGRSKSSPDAAFRSCFLGPRLRRAFLAGRGVASVSGS